jgi:hypothetical protein
MRRALEIVFLAALASTLAACGDSGVLGGDNEAGGGWDDAAGDADGDMDADSDADSDADGDSDVPEEEEQVDYRIPQGSGRYVFIADETHDAVVVVDSESLVIDVAEVGSHPTHLVPLADENAAAVINVDSDDATVVRVDQPGQISSVDLDTRPDTNALSASEDGRYVTAFFDPLFAEESGPPGTDQEITVMHTLEGYEAAHHLTVGMHPSRVVYNDVATRAFVVTEEGINVVDLENLGDTGLPPIVTLFDPVEVDSDSVEIAIDPNGDFAVARHEGSEIVMAAPLDGSGDPRSYELDAPPTDLDLAEDGSFGVLVIRSLGEVALFDLPLPASPSEDPFTYVDLGEAICGSATITPDGQTVLLHTTVAGEAEDRRVLTAMRRDGESGWGVDHAMLEREIHSMAAGADSATAVVIHEPVSSSELEMPYSYSLIKLDQLQVKFQQIPVDPGQLLLTPDGDYGFLLLRDDSQGIRDIDIIDMETFIVDTLVLGSPPTAAGYAAETDKVFVAQEHPAGRMTFIGVHEDTVKTVTGYALNDEIDE